MHGNGHKPFIKAENISQVTRQSISAPQNTFRLTIFCTFGLQRLEVDVWLHLREKRHSCLTWNFSWQFDSQIWVFKISKHWNKNWIISPASEWKCVEGGRRWGIFWQKSVDDSKTNVRPSNVHGAWRRTWLFAHNRDIICHKLNWLHHIEERQAEITAFCWSSAVAFTRDSISCEINQVLGHASHFAHAVTLASWQNVRVCGI